MGRPTTRRGDLPPIDARRSRDSAGAVLRAVLDHGPIARSSVARVTRLSAASVTGVVSSLLDRGLMCEVPEAAGPPGIGRPHVPLDIQVEGAAVIGVHIAVPRITVSLLDLRGRIIAQVQEPHGRTDPASVIATVAARIATLRRRHPRRRVLGLGLATGGWVDSLTGTIVEHPALDWRDVRIGAALAEATGLPVRTDNNSRALLRAELLFGAVAGRARESAVHLFVGNVVDVAFATGGAIHQGPRSASGAVAHLPVEGCREACSCGRVGCLQAAVSERVLVRRAMTAGLIDRPEIPALVKAAADGSAGALELLRDRARLVGRAAALLLDLFDPEVLVVAEAGANQLPECLATLRAEVAAWSSAGAEMERVVHPSSFPGTVLAVAGGAVALDQVYASPLDLGVRLRAS
ncbi:ROK family protein [Actinoplanes regularis]|uniref:Sugar kinase of the NBD/HSP70 family, may contain an N-terminal HTH domain n=1 Tax=Actinoplanes regularis TaxID=52697 RepID=A0A239F3V6_9ACTN|nr:ROK family protein [Actinoplanes regularis]GIE89958.1 sugar kinase [Actinoplanes regularis]GLW33597.1 sugar kinase [Actinoplanes regularis]SNS51515.1 Sugar kinase of the NBD/HSP70 family, may contain an N-terminal HTH domain [Actinoplanes regularis]